MPCLLAKLSCVHALENDTFWDLQPLLRVCVLISFNFDSTCMSLILP